MKKFYLFSMAVFLSICGANAQFVVGSDGMTITSSTSIHINGVWLSPSAELTIADNELTVSATPITGSPPGIAKVYNFENPITFEGDIGIFYLTGDLNGNTEATLQLATSGNGVSFNSLLGSTVSTGLHVVTNTVSPAATIQSLTASQPSALPVILSSFEVTKEGATASLIWETTSEENSNFFEVQRSSDGKHWQQIGRVMSWIDSHTLRSYTFSDESPARGANLYRLKMVDNDGSYAYSIIKSVQFDHVKEISIYPNPTSDFVKVNVDNWSDVSLVKLFNSAGKMLYVSSKSASAREIELKKYPSGIYFIQLVRNDGSTETLKILKR